MRPWLGSRGTISSSSRRNPRLERGTRRPVPSSCTKSKARSAARRRESRSIASANSSPGGSPSGGTERISWKMASACSSRSAASSEWRASASEAGDVSRRCWRALSRTSPISARIARREACAPTAPGPESPLTAPPSGSLRGERADVADDRPAVALGQVPPRGHRAAPVGDLPEDLAVRLVLDAGRRPVHGLGIQRDRGGAVALALGAVAGGAVDLGDLLALIDGLLVTRDRILLRLLGGPSPPGCLGVGDPGRRSAQPQEEQERGAENEPTDAGGKRYEHRVRLLVLGLVPGEPETLRAGLRFCRYHPGIIDERHIHLKP